MFEKANEILGFRITDLMFAGTDEDLRQTKVKACEATPSTMAAVLALPDATVEEICASIKDEVVVCANYNCPGQLVISGSIPGIDQACEKLLAAGAKRALKLKVGGAFHSPLMKCYYLDNW